MSDTADSTTTTELAMGATTLLHKCVQGHDEPQGGGIHEFGKVPGLNSQHTRVETL